MTQPIRAIVDKAYKKIPFHSAVKWGATFYDGILIIDDKDVVSSLTM
jgi:hypothetical protein